VLESREPTDIHEYLRARKRTGKIRFYACRAAADTFGLTDSKLAPAAEGIVSSMWFLKEKAVKADTSDGRPFG
jgi:peroxiredoxin family protein